MKLKNLIHWTVIVPIASAVFYLFGFLNNTPASNIIGALLLFSSVLAAVHHAEVIAHKVGEPYGTIILAICITVLEVGLIVSFMLSGSEGAQTYARDTVFAAVMIRLNGVRGICIWMGSRKDKE